MLNLMVKHAGQIWRLNCSSFKNDVAQHGGNRLVHYQGNQVVHIIGYSLVHIGGNSTNLNAEQIAVYLEHHLNVVGVKKQLFSDQAITAIYQGSAGILRKANFLARGGLIAAATDKEQVVSAEHVRLASSELILH